MKKNLLSLIAMLLLNTSMLSANDDNGMDESYEANQDTSDHIQLRVGMASIGGTFYLESGFGVTTPDSDLKNGSGFDVSLVTGVNRSKGFDYRSVLTLQLQDVTLGDVTLGDVKASSTMFIGEGEIAYNINQYISPFIGFYGGIGVTDIPDINEKGNLTYDLGVLIGISGKIYKGLGYYAKYTAGIKGFNVADNTTGIRQKPKVLRLGASYTF